jgi:hypothetical protein
MQIQKLQFLVSTIGLFAGISAVALSLSLASQASSHEATRMTARELYWGEEILPDHLLYPGLMLMDRVQLQQAEPTEQMYMQVVYAGRRLVYAQELLKKGKPTIALSTLTKSQKYLLQAGNTALTSPHTENAELLAYLLKAITFHLRELEKIKPSFAESEFGSVSALAVELELVQQQLLELHRSAQ